MTPLEHYYQAGAMLRAVEAELPSLKEGNEVLEMEWIISMIESAKVHAQLAAIPFALTRDVIDPLSDEEDDRP